MDLFAKFIASRMAKGKHAKDMFPSGQSPEMAKSSLLDRANSFAIKIDELPIPQPGDKFYGKDISNYHNFLKLAEETLAEAEKIVGSLAEGMGKP